MHLDSAQLISLAKKYDTPLYVYNGDLIVEKFQKLYSSIEYRPLQILYAMKANYNPHILKLLEKKGAWIDAVSPGDVLMARKCGFSADRILYTANNITTEEMKAVAREKVVFNIGSLTELERYGKEFPDSSICLRFNPDVVAGAHKQIQTGGPLTKFGILMKDAEVALEISNRNNLKITGLHKHTGSGINEIEAFFKAADNLLEIADPKLFPDLEFIDFGGGMSVPYKPGEKETDYIAFGKRISDRFDLFCKKFGKELSLFIEPGKYLVAQAGVLLVQVTTLKNNEGRLIAGTNSGFPQLIRPVFYKETYLNKETAKEAEAEELIVTLAYHNISNLSNPDKPLKKYDICGNICETGDNFAEDREIPEIKEGDLLAIEDAGAYCYSMGGIYNLRAMPAEVLFYDGKDKLIRKRLSNEELVDSIINECS